MMIGRHFCQFTSILSKMKARSARSLFREVSILDMKAQHYKRIVEKILCAYRTALDGAQKKDTESAKFHQHVVEMSDELLIPASNSLKQIREEETTCSILASEALCLHWKTKFDGIHSHVLITKKKYLSHEIEWESKEEQWQIIKSELSKLLLTIRDPSISNQIDKNNIMHDNKKPSKFSIISLHVFKTEQTEEPLIAYNIDRRSFNDAYQQIDDMGKEIELLAEKVITLNNGGFNGNKPNATILVEMRKSSDLLRMSLNSFSESWTRRKESGRKCIDVLLRASEESISLSSSSSDESSNDNDDNIRQKAQALAAVLAAEGSASLKRGTEFYTALKQKCMLQISLIDSLCGKGDVFEGESDSDLEEEEDINMNEVSDVEKKTTIKKKKKFILTQEDCVEYESAKQNLEGVLAESSQWASDSREEVAKRVMDFEAKIFVAQQAKQSLHLLREKAKQKKVEAARLQNQLQEAEARSGRERIDNTFLHSQQSLSNPVVKQHEISTQRLDQEVDELRKSQDLRHRIALMLGSTPLRNEAKNDPPPPSSPPLIAVTNSTTLRKGKRVSSGPKSELEDEADAAMCLANATRERIEKAKARHQTRKSR